VITLEINGKQQSLEAETIDDVLKRIRDAIPPTEVTCLIRVNGIEMSEDQLGDFSVSSIQTIEVQTANPGALARESLGETQQWIERICGVLSSIAADFRLGRDKEGANRLVTIVDALQVLVGLLQGIHTCLELEQGQRVALDRVWEEAEVDLKNSIASLLQDMENGDPVRLADSAGHTLPRSLGRFREILYGIHA
jgi:hypothetical protein